MELSFLRNNKKKTAACNFQTMPMNCFVMSYDLMRGQIESYKYMIRSYLQFHDGRAVKKPLRNIYTLNSKIKNDNKLKGKICFILKIYYFLQ